MLAANHPSLAHQTLALERGILFRQAAAGCAAMAGDRSASTRPTIAAAVAGRLGPVLTAGKRFRGAATAPPEMEAASALGGG